MGTRADFYIKEADKKELTWLASIAWDGYPDGIDEEVLNAKNQTDYIASLQKFLSERDDVTMPENGWPWPWDNSNTTDYGYCFHEGRVMANCFGHGWHDPYADVEEDDEPKTIWEHQYPDMSAKKNVRYDKGSGAIFISLRSK